MGLTGLIASTGLALASPAPPRPEVEGRESNPVVLEYYETEKPRKEAGTGPTIPHQSKWDEQVTRGALADLIGMTMNSIRTAFVLR
jgi:hypothetical protein